MGTGNLAPDHPDLGAADLLLALVDVGNLLAEVEATFVLARSVLAAFLRSRNVLGSLSVVDTLDLDQAGAGRLVVSATLVAQVTSPDVAWLAPSFKCHRFVRALMMRRRRCCPIESPIASRSSYVGPILVSGIGNRSGVDSLDVYCRHESQWLFSRSKDRHCDCGPAAPGIARRKLFGRAKVVSR